MEGEAIFEDLASEAESENSEQFSSDDEVESERREVEAESTADQEVLPSTSHVPAIKSLQNICSDSDVNKDAKFLDDLQKLFENNETSLLFKPHLRKIKAGFYEGRHSLKKRILTKTRQDDNNDNTNSSEDNDSLLQIANEDERNIFDMLEDM